MQRPETAVWQEEERLAVLNEPAYRQGQSAHLKAGASCMLSAAPACDGRHRSSPSRSLATELSLLFCSATYNVTYHGSAPRTHCAAPTMKEAWLQLSPCRLSQRKQLRTT